MSTLRVAVPPALLAAATAAAAHAAPGGAEVRLLDSGAALDSRRLAGLQRLWLEWRSGRGASAVEAGQALEDPALRAVLLLLDREADAALLPSAAAAAWSLMDSGATGPCLDVWLAPELAWFDWPGAGAGGVAQVVAAADWLQRRTRQSTAPALISFAGGRNPLAAATARWMETLAARVPCLKVELYSPLFHAGGRLQAQALVQAILKEWARSPLAASRPLLCVPQLERAEFAARWQADGGTFTGAFRAGAERLAARLDANAAPATWSATLEWMARLSA